ncbi:MAG: beta-ketoacyl-ACP synthase 3 [Aquabacterium sp.]
MAESLCAPMQAAAMHVPVRAGITATGRFTPGWVMDNHELVSRHGLKVDDAWIVDRTGIRSRHWLPPDETTSDMAVRAAQACLTEAGLQPGDIDRIILATISPDRPSPSTATTVAYKLGARCMAFDVSAACSGFLYGLDLAAGALHMGARRVLVIAADTRSRYLNPKDHRSMVLFADGAACALVEPVAQGGLLSVVCGAEGQAHVGAFVPAGGAQRPASAETVAAGEHYLQVDPTADIFEKYVRYVQEASSLALDRAHCTMDDIDLFITHQGNGRLVQIAADAMGVPAHKVVNEVAHHGNTAGATIPIVLDELRRDGRLRAGMRVLFSAAGAGITFAAAVHQF